ncbi:hypothetical protein [Flagellimonas algicola]|uniref:CopG family transcriptional regulator n=1 Tax=Flagellimonas algicola TaxID=2583815 RepID=A0ABY2WNZ2_9FLAO|nr:hypothetical protein [Allomuricauda algicola]TMU56467.1 hypothetical protein FGG15_02710 [Allomuricauda algicola]
MTNSKHKIQITHNDELISCDKFKHEQQHKKNIDISSSTKKRLQILAAYHDRDYKNFIQDILTTYAVKHLPNV